MRHFAPLLVLILAGCATAPAPVPIPPPQIADVQPAPPAGQQWLYGSAEGAAASLQTYHVLTDYALAIAKTRPVDSVVFAATGGFVPCGNKPLAAVFDADETLIWNLGAMRWFAENGVDFVPAVWAQWEVTGVGKAAAMPGAIEALAKLRAAGITVIANTNRSAKNAAGSEATLKAAGLGDFKHGETLFLAGDDADGSSKDGRRATISSRFCVITLAGDQMGDFRQAFNVSALSVMERKALVQSAEYAPLWGAGWFLYSNPVYGPSIRGGYDDIFQAGAQWQPQPDTGGK